MTRECKTCTKQFTPSSRHLNCPHCRNIISKKLCVNCSSTVQRKSIYCKSCAQEIRNRKNKERGKYSGLQVFISRARKRGKLGNLTIEDLKEIWDNQKGICVYSKVKLNLPSYSNKNDPRTTASLDRIDSNLPYEKDNVQFVSIIINLMKSQLTHAQTIDFCKTVSRVWCE